MREGEEDGGDDDREQQGFQFLRTERLEHLGGGHNVAS
jgi:hypothetical protein